MKGRYLNIYRVIENSVVLFSPGIVVMGWNSQSKGRGFESQLDGYFSHYFVVKLHWFLFWKRPKINEKETGAGPFFLKKQCSSYIGSSKLRCYLPTWGLTTLSAFQPTPSGPKIKPALGQKKFTCQCKTTFKEVVEEIIWVTFLIESDP